jgi:hypothetical protein
MKNKLIVAALAAALFCGLAFTACENVTNMKLVYDKAETVDKVNAVKFSVGNGVILSWEAPDDATGFDVYIRKADGNTVRPLDSLHPAPVVYNPDGVSFTPGTNLDHWECAVPGAGYPSGAYEFGVRTKTWKSNVLDSDIKWSDSVTL